MMTPVAHNVKVSEDTVDEELKAVVRALHPQWSDEVLEQHIKGLHSARWIEAYRDIFRELEAKKTSFKKATCQVGGCD